MKTIYTCFIAIALIMGQKANAQNARFVKQGTVQFEKKVNIYALFKDQIKKYPDNSWTERVFEDYQKNNPQFKTLKSTLDFNKTQTLFNPIADESTTSNWGIGNSANQNNVIYTNTATGMFTTQKKIYEETYLVKDSVRNINWKITDEFREIAGYNCRRANAIIMDSIYVVAFYTDKIPVSVGPESFGGLPGMILGVALPKEHVTWFATNVIDQSIGDDKLKAPVKGKPTDNKKLYAILKEALKDWGEGAQEIFRSALL